MATKQQPTLWSFLPTDLLFTILEKLSERDDLLACSSVCLEWRSVIVALYPQLEPYFQFLSQTHKPTLPPFILLSETPDNGYNLESCVLYSFHSPKIQLYLPELDGRWYSSSSYGWLLTIGFDTTQNIYLLNPVTRDQIELPPPAREFEKPQYLRVITSTSPWDPNCIFLAHTNADSYKSKLAICRPGDKSWTKVESFCFCSDTIFYMGEFYAIDFMGHIYRIKFWDSSVQLQELGIQPVKLSFIDNYLVELKEELLLVQRFINSSPNTFKLYKLDWQRNKWISMENLGDNAILLGKNSSTSVAVTKDFAANCIYFVNDADAGRIMNNSDRITNNAGVSNIATKQFTWFPPFSKYKLSTLNWLYLV